MIFGVRTLTDSDSLDQAEARSAEGTGPQRKHLLQKLVKKVVVHDRRTLEVWYALPVPKPHVDGFEDWHERYPRAGSNCRPPV